MGGSRRQSEEQFYSPPMVSPAQRRREEAGGPVDEQGRSSFDARQWLSAIIESCDDAIIGKDLSGRILSWHAGATRLYGLTSEEAIGRHISELAPSDYQEEVSTILRDVARGQRLDHLETVRCHRDGEILNVLLTVNPIEDGRGRVIGSVSVVRDISERKRMQKEQAAYAQLLECQNLELEAQKEELEAQQQELLEVNRYLEEAQSKAVGASKAKSEFLANMSHELRTPLNAIIGFTQRLLKRLAETIPERDLDALQTVEHNAKHLLELINDILDFSKIEAGKMRLDLMAFDLTAAIREVVKQISPLADGKPIEIGLELPDRPMQIHADRVKVKQIVSNLFSNAIKYTDRGQVTISVDESTDLDPGRMARVVVCDTGIGIRPEDQKRLFQEFTQLDGSATRRAGGTGLGLVITTQYVEMHGGRIEVESSFGRGSRFTVLLPLESGPGQKDAPLARVRENQTVTACCGTILEDRE